MDTNKEIIEKKDEKIAQLERLLVELKEAQMQSAATIAVGHNARSLSPPKGIFKFFLKAAGVKIILAILVFLVITSGGIWLFAGSTFKQESVTFVEHVQELATLATAEAHMKAVIHEEDNMMFGKDISIDLPGTKRELLLVVPATVIAGVDLKGITSEDMVINEETKEINITLPHAKLIQEPSLQMDKILAVDNGGIFRADIKMDEGFKKAAEAQEQIRQEAISVGLLDTAEKNAEKVLKEFFKNIGYSVNVTFN
ncbi:DUF4230 domain-containing protein [Paenibacillus timonensis]|uniref:DUF4230 domain-containing protein n=1 Tax=Paenibacillus timonensis TaxID=225915 RepID=A0ABW3SCM4_9BACL|nr:MULTISPECIES: DUF4230 domain-containing protein [Paenibacillus]MCH1640876.1 DUF4230 domain-containing protein [Paenibacillus timonensis]MDU2239235.1 DUF4230 domain-containing protein [Paenibacillus sp.]